MKVSEIIEELGLSVYAGEKGLGKEVQGGYVSDLLSDVMGHASAGQVWITLQTHNNVAAIASLKDLSAVILVKGLEPDPEMVDHCTQEAIPIVGTSMDTFEIAGKLYQFLNRL